MRTRILFIDPSNQPFYDFAQLQEGGVGPCNAGLLETARLAHQEIGDVYFAQRHCPEMLDTEDGIRFLPWREHAMPAFGRLDFVLVVRKTAVLSSLREAYPDAGIAFWEADRAIAEAGIEAACTRLRIRQLANHMMFLKMMGYRKRQAASLDMAA